MKDIPVIKLFTVNGNYYVYDTYNNRILNISKEQFTEIKRLEGCGIEKYREMQTETVAYNDVILLLNKGYFQSDFIRHVCHPYTDYVDFLINRNVNELVLQVTKDCNFKCRYCLFTRKNNIDRCHEKTEMSWEIAKKSIDILFSHSADADSVSIAFYGGEPLLNFELIQKVVAYANDIFQSKKIHYSMTINGSLLSQEVIDFLIEQEIHVGISLDGPLAIQNKHRKFYNSGGDTFNIVYNNVCRLRQTNPDYFNNHVTFQPVRMQDEDINVVQNFFDDMDLLPNTVFIRAASTEGIDYIYSGYELVNKEHPANLSDIEKMDSILANNNRFTDCWHHAGPCVPGVRKLFVDTNGYLYPCEKVLETSANKIGDVFSGFNLMKIKEILNVGKLTENECKRCWASRFCSMCVVDCLHIEQDMLSKDQKTIGCRREKDKALAYIKDYVQRKG